MSWSCKYLFFGPATLRSGVDRPDLDAVFARGFDGSLAPANWMELPAGVKALLARCCPPAVARLVVAFVVDSVDRVIAGWARPHVSKKRLERIAPTVAHRDPLGAVMGVSVLVRIETSALDASPYSVFRRLAEAVSLANGAGDVTREAAARDGRSVAEVSPAHNAGRSAAALAGPQGLFLVPRPALCAANYNETPESLAGHVDGFALWLSCWAATLTVLPPTLGLKLLGSVFGVLSAFSSTLALTLEVGGSAVVWCGVSRRHSVLNHIRNISAWRPGKPRPERWPESWRIGWEG